MFMFFVDSLLILDSHSVRKANADGHYGPHGVITCISGPKKLIVVASINLLFSYLEFEA